MKKQLPYIAFEGVGKTKEEVLDSLIAIEPILVMVGYDVHKEEVWNNKVCIENKILPQEMSLHSDGSIIYIACSSGNIRFKTTEINKFINYMIKEGYLK